MEYRTKYKGRLILVKPDTHPKYSHSIWICFSDFKPVIGYYCYPNVMQAMRDLKQQIRIEDFN